MRRYEEKKSMLRSIINRIKKEESEDFRADEKKRWVKSPYNKKSLYI